MRIGIIGFGGMGNWHRETIEEIEGLELAGIYDIDKERVEYAAKSNVHAYKTMEELLGDKTIELVLIATPNNLHKPIAITAMKAGKNVVSEKPVALNSKDFQEMIDVSKETGMYFTVHQNRRWDEDFLTIKKIYDENKLGEVFRIESRVHGSRGIPGDWRQNKENGGGMILDWGVHLLDQILLMLDGVKLSTVYASTTNVTNQLVDDGFTTILTFENKVEVLVEVGTSNFVSLPRWYVLGQNGTAIINDWDITGEIVCATGIDEKDVIPVRTAAGLTKTMAPRRDDTIKREKLSIVKSDIKDFYRNVMAVIENGEQSKIKLLEVMRVMKLMETILLAAYKKQILDFER